MAVGRGENKSDWGVNMQHSFSIYDRQVGCIFFFGVRAAADLPIPIATPLLKLIAVQFLYA